MTLTPQHAEDMGCLSLLSYHCDHTPGLSVATVLPFVIRL